MRGTTEVDLCAFYAAGYDLEGESCGEAGSRRVSLVTCWL